MQISDKLKNKEKHWYKTKSSSDHSQRLPRLHLGQGIQLLLLTTWTLYLPHKYDCLILLRWQKEPIMLLSLPTESCCPQNLIAYRILLPTVCCLIAHRIYIHMQNLFITWMHKENWIQCWRQDLSHSYKICSVVHIAKKVHLPCMKSLRWELVPIEQAY